MKYSLTEIKNIANFINGYPFKPSHWETFGFKIIRIQNLTDPNKAYNKTSIKVPDKYFVKKGDILVSWSATINVFEWDEDDAYLNQHIFKVEFDEEKVTKAYFKLALRKTINDLIKFSHGSTMKHVVKGDFDNHKIPLPPLDDQIRIATVLTRAEKLIAKRKESIKALDELLKSTFLEMFGDPVRNEKGWERISLSEILLKIESGRSPVCLDRPAISGEWGVLKLGAVTQCVFKPNENKALPDSEKPNPEIEIKTDDLLFSRKNTYELVAACAYVWKTPPKLMMSDLIFRLVPRDKNLINSIFLQALLSFSSKRKMIQRLAGGAAGSMPNISKAKLLEHKIEVPHLPLQNQFADIVEKVEAVKSRYSQSLTELENLYGSLSQRAFKGELDLSTVPVEKGKANGRVYLVK